jgi:uncharacterized protein (TIGR02118 family)
MYTMAILTKAKPGVSTEQFLEHYRTTHFELASRLPGLVSYQQARVAHGAEAWTSPESYPEYDALSIYTFESYQAARAAFDSEAGRAVDADTGLFIDWPTVLFAPAKILQAFRRDA